MEEVSDLFGPIATPPNSIAVVCMGLNTLGMRRCKGDLIKALRLLLLRRPIIACDFHTCPLLDRGDNMMRTWFWEERNEGLFFYSRANGHSLAMIRSYVVGRMLKLGIPVSEIAGEETCWHLQLPVKAIRLQRRNVLARWWLGS
jgi:hypothetical protein